MTPGEAVAELKASGLITHLSLVKLAIESVAARAKADETRRCVARIKMWFARQRWEPGLSIARQESITKELVNGILVSGGLEVEE